MERKMRKSDIKACGEEYFVLCLWSINHICVTLKFFIMVMRNKNKAAFIFFGLLCGLVYLLGSCSGESDLNGCGDLSIGM